MSYNLDMFSKRLKELRIEKGLTQQSAGAMLGIDTSTFRKWENGQRRPDIDMLCKIADAFEVSTDYLLGRTDFY